MMRDSTRKKFERELHAGRLWRAKEILQGNIPGCGYDIELFEEYGRLLLTLGDEVEAGKYLFLSGVRRDEYAHAIELFLSRHGRRDPLNLFRSLPAGGRRTNLDDYPPAVVQDFAALDLDPARAAKRLHRDHSESTFQARAIRYGCLATFILLVAVMLFVLGVGLKRIFDL